MTKILVIIVTYNAMKWINRCIGSVINSSVKSDIYIVDNGSNDGTQEYVRQNFPAIAFIQSKENLGFGKANNIGLQYALDNDYDYVYLLNQDAWVMPDTFELLIEQQKKNPQYGILSPIQIEANMKALDKNFSNLCTPELFNALYFKQVKSVYPVHFVMAAHWLISRQCLLTVGGFSPTFPHYGEDTNYIDRAIYHGFKIGLVPYVEAVHDRENRQVSRDKEIYAVYIYCLILLSEISRPFNIVRMFAYFAKSLISYKSFKLVKYLFKIIFSYTSIRKNRIRSRGRVAFLNSICSSK